MDIAEEILKNEMYKKVIDKLSSETLRVIADDHNRALKEAKKGIDLAEPEKVNDLRHLKVVANGMQELARSLLEKRKQ
ncbi:MAG TPA: hypothetical protein VMR41_06435 [Patescibacteria group bacterium]|nr:hypothetical protein [Patescibacteria group bacterium]